MNQEETCQCCGAKIKIWEHSLSPGLVKTLIKFANAIKRKKENDIDLQKEAGFNLNEYNNFQKLRYFGLVAKIEGEAGHWLITRNGWAFLKSELTMPKKVKTFRNKIQEKSNELVSIKDYFNNVFNEGYWQKEFDFEIKQGELL